MEPILQEHLPAYPWMDPRLHRLPGILPVEAPEDWLRVDEAYGGQMARRDALIAEKPAAVHALLPEGEAAAGELYARVLGILAGRSGYEIGAQAARRPDGMVVPLDAAAPLLTLGRLVQEDLCLLAETAEGPVLTGAVLCFPASWTLAQKIGRSMGPIHGPVAAYTEDLARRIDRLFTALRPAQPLWRMNALVYDDPELHQPRLEGARRPPPVQRLYMRCERQCLLRLPQTRAVVFSIHTYIVPMAKLPEDARAAAAGI